MKDAGGHGSDGRGGGSAERNLIGNNNPEGIFHNLVSKRTPLGGGLTSAAQEKVGIGKMIDETHYPSRTPGDRDAMKSLAQAGGPKAAPVPVHGGMNTRTGVNGFGFRVGLGTNFMRG